jgi:hypothetical protein
MPFSTTTSRTEGPGARIMCVYSWTRTLILAEVARLLVLSPTREKKRNRVQRRPNLSSCDGTRTVPSRASRLRNDDAVAMARGRGAASFRRHPIDQRRNALATHHYKMLVQGRPRDRMKSCSDASVTTLPGFHIRHFQTNSTSDRLWASGLRQEVDLQCASPRETFVPRGRLLLLLITC